MMSILKNSLLAIVALLMVPACCQGIKVERWRVAELSFCSDKDYARSSGEDVVLDVVFVHKATGTKLVRPAFWDGGHVFRVRFAPTETGRWQWHTACAQDPSLDGRKGALRCVKYKGNLDIYRHGFVTADTGRKYMTYADGTPFFYLGDTHWGMYTEEIDEPGPHAGNTGAGSHFKYIVDKRVEQGFTVYQSEPIGSKFNLADGHIDDGDIEGFREADRYYQYIADAGLVHANAEFFFVAQMNMDFMKDDAAVLKRLSRYWVARFGAYPVMWTLAQEADNDFYRERGDHWNYDRQTNPWVTVAECLHGCDCYAHPLSAHQENAIFTTVTGYGTCPGFEHEWGTESAFLSDEVARRTGHNWWAAQYSPSLTRTPADHPLRDYWQSPRPAVDYEGRYCYLWTKDFGERAQGWIAFLTGFCGYGYGAVDMWLYQSTYDIDTTSDDGKEKITPEDKAVYWCDALELESARQMAYLKDFLTSFEWWTLTPVFADDKEFTPEDNAAFTYAHTPKGKHVLYFFGESAATGTMAELPANKAVALTWMNPRTGEFAEPVPASTAADGTLALPHKPDTNDWVMIVQE